MTGFIMVKTSLDCLDSFQIYLCTNRTQLFVYLKESSTCGKIAKVKNVFICEYNLTFNENSELLF